MNKDLKDLLNEANELIEVGNYNLANSVLDQAILKTKIRLLLSAEISNSLGVMAELEQNFLEAIMHYKTAKRLNPNIKITTELIFDYDS